MRINFAELFGQPALSASSGLPEDIARRQLAEERDAARKRKERIQQTIDNAATEVLEDIRQLAARRGNQFTAKTHPAGLITTSLYKTSGFDDDFGSRDWNFHLSIQVYARDVTKLKGILQRAVTIAQPAFKVGFIKFEHGRPQLDRNGQGSFDFSFHLGEAVTAYDPREAITAFAKIAQKKGLIL